MIRLAWLVVLIGLVMVACGPSKEEIAAAEKRREAAAEAEEAKKKKAAEQVAALEEATQAAVARMQRFYAAFGEAKSVAACAAGKVSETVKPLPVRHTTLTFAKGGLDKLYDSWSSTALDADVFSRLFADKPRDDRDRERAAAAAKVINEAKHIAVIRESAVTFPKVDPTINVYTPGETNGTLVLFIEDKAVCQVTGKAKNADKVEALASDDRTLRDVHASGALEADLRKRLMEDLTKNMKAALGESFGGFARESS
jgi:hypothetical protein